MTPLVDALQTLGLAGAITMGGRRITIQGERCAVHVFATAGGDRYYTWCDDPRERTVEVYADPAMALRAGLRRAAGGGVAAEQEHDPGESERT